MKLWCETILPGFNGAAGVEKKPKSDIVFLHGTGANARMWKNQVAYFSQLGHPCTVIDLRGHGFSHEPYEKTSLETHLQDVVHTLQNANVRFPAHFIGHSLGAMISLLLAERHPEKVKSIFAACLPGKVIKPVTKTFDLLINGPIQALKESELKQYLGWREQTLTEMAPFTLKELAILFADFDFLTSRPEVHCPVHLACGRFDLIATFWQAQQLHRQFPGSTLKTFEWSGHNFMDKNPRAFNAWISRYIEDL